MSTHRSYTDEALGIAIADSTSWRGTLRALGLKATSSGALRSVRTHAQRLGLDYSHFHGQRSWTKESLETALTVSDNWPRVVDALGLDHSSTAVLKGHAARYGFDVSHMMDESDDRRVADGPSIAHLDRAGTLLAATWFTLAGYDVSWPLEPCRYDLLVDGHGTVRRVQVKTTSVRVGQTWKVYLSTTQGERRTYTPDEIDDFFIVDGDLHCYLMPLAAVGGFHAVHLSGYEQYRVAPLLLAATPIPTAEVSASASSLPRA